MKKNLCKFCNGTGWVVKKKNGVELAVKCRCQYLDIFITKGEKANIPPRFLGAELKIYKPDQNNPSQGKAKKEARKFIDNYPSVYDGLLFQGPVGIGKTRLLCSIATELMKKFENIDAFYIDWNDLVREMRSGQDVASRDFSSINQLINKLSEVELLLFDELGASKISPWVYDNIYYLFNRRYNNKKITICATNYFDNTSDGGESLSQRVGDRIRSRLYEMTEVVEIRGIDYRLQNG